VFWAAVLFVLALLSRGGGHVVVVGLSIASVAYGALLGVFLLGTLSRRATETGTMVGMVAGLALNLLLWQQSGPLQVTLFGHSMTFPKIAWTWYVLLGSLGTFAVGWLASVVLPQAVPKEGH
jgi:SSS family solute:Na+ symporter